jgi:hypothetical protein
MERSQIAVTVCAVLALLAWGAAIAMGQFTDGPIGDDPVGVEPPVVIITKTPEEKRVERIGAWMEARRNTFEVMANSAKHASGPLTYYLGDLDNRDEVVRYLVNTQYRDTQWQGVEGCSVHGAWAGDGLHFRPSAPHFDEQVMGLAMGMLVLHIQENGNRNWVRDDGETVSSLGTMWNGYRCLIREQHVVSGYDWRDSDRGPGFQGIPGCWPIRPGTCDGIKAHAISNERARLITFNDGATSGNLSAILWLLTRSPGYQQGIDRAVLCGEGTWEVMRRNGGWLPEQAHRTGVPAWGRNHEPPCWSPRATAYGVEILCMVHAVTGDRIWLDRAETTQELLDANEQVPGGWYYMLEPHTMRPIYASEHDAPLVTYSPLHAAKQGTTITFFQQWEKHPGRSRTYLTQYKQNLGR